VILVAALLGVPLAAQELSVDLPADDGTPLATDVYCPLPLCLGSWAVVLQRTPYGKTSQGLPNVCRAFNLLGYACVAQDERGTGASGGHYSGYLEEGPDGRATLRWLSRQWWCDGKVGTFGVSALGMTQYSMAPGAPPVLKAQVPMIATPDFYHHAVYEGGALRYGLDDQWLAAQDALDVLATLKAHRLWDSFWDSFAVLPRADEIDVPALHMGGWYDIFLQGTLDAFTRLQHQGGPGALGRQKLLIGPWTHYGFGQITAGALTYPTNAFAIDDFIPMWRDWFDCWLGHDCRAVDAMPTVRVYLMGAVGEPRAPGNRWVDLDDWPPAGGTVSYSLSPAGVLREGPAPRGEAELVMNPADPVPTRGGRELLDNWLDAPADTVPGAGPHDQRAIEGRGDVLVFTSAVLTKPLTVMGRVRARVWLRPDTPDLDLTVRLTDVYPDGRSMLLADGIQRARMRCSDAYECFLTPGEAVELVVDLWSTAYVFNAGHRIRIDVAGSNYPRFEVNPNDGGDLNDPGPGVVAHPFVLFGPEYPSRLDLPSPDVVRQPRRSLRGSPLASGSPAHAGAGAAPTEEPPD
jgi:uncharacterized protein